MNDATELPFARPLSGDPVIRTPGGLVPARTPLIGRRIRLEPVDPDRHAAALYHVSHGSEAARQVWNYLPAGPWSDEAAFTGWLRTQAALFDRVAYALCPTQTGAATGMASYLDIHPLDGVIEIGGIWFAPALQRTRAATEALFLLLTYAMDELGYRRMQWRCNALNAKSRSAARRLGFRFEGVFYNHMVVKGRNRDTAWYSIVEDEWPELREIIGAWLDDSNFDADGAPRRSLAALTGQRRVTS
jgi:RimJ/RimL family protein N-acetyltransferase